MNNLFGKSLSDLEKISVDLGFPKFRGKQLYDWIYGKRVDELYQCKNLPKDFIQELENENYGINYPKVIRVLEDDQDETRKYLLQMDDGELVESVLMNYNYGNSVCLSTQVGCAMGCSFCASGKNGKTRNLKAEEITGQLVAIEKDSGKAISNIVLMGMGEPLDNYDEVMKFIQLANKNLGIGQRHITLSTCGLIDKINKLADEGLQINLAVSLHSPFQESREKMMPVAKSNRLDKLIEATKNYFDKTGRRVTYEYTVIDNVNNRKEDALELKKLLGDSVHHINLIPLNPVNKKERFKKESVNLFFNELNKLGLKSTIRKSNGSNIEAACGQLRNRELEE